MSEEDCAPWLAGGACAGGGSCGRRHRAATAAALLCGAARRCEAWTRGGACDAGAGCPLVHPPLTVDGGDDDNAAAAALSTLPTARCSRSTRLVVHYDSENCAFPTAPGARAAALYSAAGVFSALTALLAAATGAAGAAEVRVYHGRALPQAARVSARTWGAVLVDAGRKEGAVDLALKGGVADGLLEALLGRLDAAAGSGGGGGAGTPSASASPPPPPPPPPVVCIVSGDRDFSDDVRRLRRAGLRTAVVYSATASADYAGLADVALPWDAVLALAAATRDGGGDGGGGGGGSGTPTSPLGGASPAQLLATTLLRTPTFQRAAAELGLHVALRPHAQRRPQRAAFPGAAPAAATSAPPSTPSPSTPLQQTTHRRRRLPCRFHLAPGGCRDGLRCRFVHLCAAWSGGDGGGAGCAAGDACGLAHGLDDPRLPAGEYACVPVPAAATGATAASTTTDGGTPTARDAWTHGGAMRLTPPKPAGSSGGVDGGVDRSHAAPGLATTGGASPPSVSGLTDTDDEAPSGGDADADAADGSAADDDGASSDSSVTLGYYPEDDDDVDERRKADHGAIATGDTTPTQDAANSVPPQQQEQFSELLPRRAPAFVLPPVRLTTAGESRDR